MSIEKKGTKQFKTVEESLNSLSHQDPDNLILESKIEQRKIDELLKKLNGGNSSVPEKKKLSLDRIGKKAVIAAVMGLFAAGYTIDFFVQKAEGKHSLRKQYDAERTIYDMSYDQYIKGDSIRYYGLESNLKKLREKEDKLEIDEKDREHNIAKVAPKIKSSPKKQ